MSENRFKATTGEVITGYRTPLAARLSVQDLFSKGYTKYNEIFKILIYRQMANIPNILITRLRPDSDADIPLPRYMTRQAAGMDLCAAVEKNLVLAPGAITLIPTGFSIAIPDGFEAQIRPRSGLAVKHGIGLINSPGTIDADYRGELMIAVINFGKRSYAIRRGDRIAQMVINRVFKASLHVVEKLDETDRSTGGFGHTGIE